jgi:hypothetical protein
MRTLPEFVDPYERATCPSMDHLEKALKLALVGAKQTPSQRPPGPALLSFGCASSETLQLLVSWLQAPALH